MQLEWPSRLRLKHPRRSPDSESAPQHMTIASGWYTSMTCYTGMQTTVSMDTEPQPGLALHSNALALHGNTHHPVCANTKLYRKHPGAYQ